MRQQAIHAIGGLVGITCAQVTELVTFLEFLQKYEYGG